MASKIIAGTGHRPKFCPCLYNETHEWLLTLKLNIMLELQKHGATAVISGAAIGFDTWLAESALALNIPLHMYIPFSEQGNTWPKPAQERYRKIIERATVVKYISETYSKDAFLKRDRAMVDDADAVFSLLNPEATSGGTYYTVKYAESKGKPVTNLWF